LDRLALIDLVTNLFAYGAVALMGCLVALAALAGAGRLSPALGVRLGAWRESLRGWFGPLAAGIAVLAMAGSLFYSEYADYVPCALCWYQRICMYPLAVILVIAVARGDWPGVGRYALPLAAIGALFSIYHIYIENNPEAESAFCTAGGPSCAVKWVDELGFITLPTLALTAFLTVIALLALGRERRAS
jgi:disulfide bond formation protein DsbB